MEADDLFRPEAVEHHRKSAPFGELLSLSNKWPTWTLSLLLALVFVAMPFLVLTRITLYARGPAIVHAVERTELTAKTQSVIAAVDVLPGALVTSGDVLVHFEAASEKANLKSAQSRLDSALVRLLVTPLDTGNRLALSSLRAEQEVASDQLLDRVLRAPCDGVVGHIRVRLGQSVAAGDVILSIARDTSSFVVSALLPGNKRPILKPGQRMRVVLNGYDTALPELSTDTIDNEVIDAQEGRRLLRAPSLAAMPMEGSVVAVTARVTRSAFVANGNDYQLYDGMIGRAEVETSSTSLMGALLGMKVGGWR